MATIKAAAHRNALVALSRFLGQDRVGGLLGPALEMVLKILRGQGGIAYRADDDGLTLVAESNLPRRAKAWLAHLPTSGEPWFVAQRVAIAQEVVVDADVAASRGGMSIRPALEDAGWQALCALPLRVGRRLHGVLVVAAQSPASFDPETLLFLEAVGALLGLATEREEARARLRERKHDADKTAHLATLGLVAGAVARDLATPLGSLAMKLAAQDELVGQLRAIDTGDMAQALDDLEVVVSDAVEALRRAQGVHSRLLALARETPRERVSLSLVVRDCAAMVASELSGRGIELELLEAQKELWVDGKLASLHLMFVQLLVHAAEQCQEGRLSQARISLQLVGEGDRHVVTIVARGRGDHLPTARVFERLVGRTGHGSLGLELARQTIRMHDGHIELGKSDEGVSIAVVLPASQPSAAAQPSLPPRASPPGAIPTIVWIDDDATFVRAMCRSIKRYRALVAGSVEEARRLLFGLTVLPELILCDVNLPDGLGTTIHANAPAALRERFVFITGAVLSDDIARYLKSSGCPTLIKPIRSEEVYALLGDPDEPPRISRTLGPTSSAPPEEPRDTPLPDPRDSFAEIAAGDEAPDAAHRDSWNEAPAAEGPTAGERTSPEAAERLRRRRSATTPPARRGIPDE